MVHYEPVNIIIDALGLKKVIINMIMQYHAFFNLIIGDKSSIIILKF